MVLRFAPLALTLAIAAPAPAQDGKAVQRIDVVLANFKFTPATIRLEHGRRYVLHLANSANGGHNFAAKAFFAAADVAPADRARIVDGKIELAGGASVDIRFTAPRAGSYDIRCTHFLHTGFGMKGRFVVA